MKAYYPAYHPLHNPKVDYSDGLPGFSHLEKPERINCLLQGFSQAIQLDAIPVEDCNEQCIRQLHDHDYVDFLLAISKHLSEEAEYTPTIFRPNLKHAPLFFQGGMYCQELGTPIGKHSIKAAINSANTAFIAAKHLSQHRTDVIALCRPPGHHAGKRRYGGYCFFNNAYIAAKHISQQLGSCAVLDLDYHFGDGSIEFANVTSPYFSLHANPISNYPYLNIQADIASDTAIDNNSHKNIDNNSAIDSSIDSQAHLDLATNLDSDNRLNSRFHQQHRFAYLQNLPAESNAKTYMQLAANLIETLKAIQSQAVIVSLGFDTLASDYIQDDSINLQPQDYFTLGQLLSSLPIPIMILSEGGYDIKHLAQCADYFAQGFFSKRK